MRQALRKITWKTKQKP